MLYYPDDSPIDREDYKVLSKSQLNIPALHMIGHRKFKGYGDKLEDHFHYNMEIVVVLKGTQQYVVNGEKYVLYANDIFAAYPYECHGNGDLLQTTGEIIWFQLDLSDSKHFFGLPSPYSEYLFLQLANERWRTKKTNTKETMVLLQAFKQLESGQKSTQILGYSNLLKFMVRNLCASPGVLFQKEVFSEDIQEAVSYIQDHIMEEMSIERIADYCGLSSSWFKVKFKEQTGTTPHDYIMALKIECARTYLKNTNKTITEISYLLNFSSSNHFSTAFKKYAGCTPKQFREQSRAPFQRADK